MSRGLRGFKLSSVRTIYSRKSPADFEIKGVTMKTNQTRKGLEMALLVCAFALVIGVGFSAPVHAQYSNPQYYPQYPNRDDRYRRGRNWDNYGNYGGSFDLRQTALNAGYNEGMRDGQDARNRGRSGDFRNESAYRKATKDYSSRLGDRELYRRYFREAYQTGFYDGYNGVTGTNYGYDPYNRNNDPYYNNNRNYDPYRNNGTWDRNNRRGRNWDRYGNYGGSFDLRQTALNAGYNEGIKEGRHDRSRGPNYDFRNNSAYRDATKDYSSRLGDVELYRRYFREGYENGYNDGLNGY